MSDMGDNAGQTAERKPERLKLPPTGVLIMLSLVFPGAGQLANGQKTKGWVIIGVSTLLLILFFIQLSSVVPPVYRALAAGVEPVIDEAYINKLYNILLILLATVLVWLLAVVDAVIVGGRKFREGVKP
jgi:TM2 domain-containing membrane protein YozV